MKAKEEKQIKVQESTLTTEEKAPDQAVNAVTGDNDESPQLSITEGMETGTAESTEEGTSEQDLSAATSTPDTTQPKLPSKMKETEYIERSGKQYKSRARRVTSVITKVAMLTALATVLLILEFPIFPAAPFYQLNFSDVPVLIGAYMFGPWIGSLISTLKVVLFFAFKGTSSFFIGELSNIVGGLAFVIPAGLIYRYRHTFKGALVGAIAGALTFILTMVVLNYFVLLPLYAKFMPQLSDPAVRLAVVFPWCVLFNLIKTVATVCLTMLLYRATRKVFKKF